METTRMMGMVRGFGGVVFLGLGLALGTLVSAGAAAPDSVAPSEVCEDVTTLATKTRTHMEWASSPSVPGKTPY